MGLLSGATMKDFIIAALVCLFIVREWRDVREEERRQVQPGHAAMRVSADKHASAHHMRQSQSDHHAPPDMHHHAPRPKVLRKPDNRPSAGLAEQHASPLARALAEELPGLLYGKPCDEGLMGKTGASTVATHSLAPTYQLHTYGHSDFVSGYCLRGGDKIFWEEYASRYFAALLEHERKEQGIEQPAGGCAKAGLECFFTQPWYLDLGANIGVHSMYVAAAGHPTMSVEGNPGTAARLHCSASALNNFNHMVVINGALGSPESPAKLCMGMAGEGNMGTAHASSDSSCPQGALVDTIVLDRVFEATKGLPAPTLVKLDVEGFEMHALQGYAKWLAIHKPKYVFIEVVPSLLVRAGGGTWQAIIQLFMDEGYNVWVADLSKQLTAEDVREGAYSEDDHPGRRCDHNYLITTEDKVPVVPENICASS